jgi:hypothetical protein
MPAGDAQPGAARQQLLRQMTAEKAAATNHHHQFVTQPVVCPGASHEETFRNCGMPMGEPLHRLPAPRNPRIPAQKSGPEIRPRNPRVNPLPQPR